MAKVSLFERCQGPRAMEIRTLVQQAQCAADIVCRDYSVYVFEKLDQVEQLAAAYQNNAELAESQEILLQTIRDLQSSAAMAGHVWVAKYSQLLTRALTSREAFDPTLPLIVNIHIDAIKVAAQGGSSPEKLRHLETELVRTIV